MNMFFLTTVLIFGGLFMLIFVIPLAIMMTIYVIAAYEYFLKNSLISSIVGVSWFGFTLLESMFFPQYNILLLSILTFVALLFVSVSYAALQRIFKERKVKKV